MLKKTITYNDYDGNERTDDFWFNLSQAELAEMDVESGGMQKRLEMISSTNDPKEIMRIFKDIVMRAYGERTADGKFRKVDSNGYRLANDFVQSEAYSELFFELFNDANKASEFMISLLPKNVQDEARKVAEEKILTGKVE
jgi:hypothetical protein